MTLAEIIRAQLATGRPLRVTRALLEALDESERAEGPVTPEEQATARAYVERRDAQRHATIMSERDEARAEVARLTAILDRVEDGTLDHAADAASWEAQCADARADAARLARQLAEAQQSLRERIAEREALCERVSQLEAGIREAEERGARWMHAAAVECSRYIGADHAMPKLNVQRICEAARKAGEHE